MTSPGGAEVGRASVRVWPDTKGFKEELEAKLSAINARLEVEVEPKLDTAKIRAQLQALDLRDIDMTIRIDGLTKAFLDLTDLEVVVNHLDGRTINIGVDVDTGAALAKIAALEAALKALNDSIKIGAGAAGGAGSAGFNGGENLRTIFRVIVYIAAFGAIAALLVYAGAALTAAWGILATAIAGVPAALSLAAVPVAALALGMDGIKKAAKTLNPEMEKLKKTISGLFEKGFTQAFKTIKPLFSSVLTPGFSNVAKSINEIAIALANMAATKDVQTLLRNIFNGVSNSISLIKPGILDITDSLLILAGRSSLFDALVNTINAFGEAWRRNLIDNINNGSLDESFRQLQNILLSLTEGITSFIHNGIEVLATAGPGITAFFDSLTEFFNKFDWARLGAATGAVFQGLADAIRQVPQSAIDGITAAFERMGAAFKDPTFVSTLTSIATQLPIVLDTITEGAKDFIATVDIIVKAIGFLNGLQDGSSIRNISPQWLQNLSDEIDRFFGVLPPKAQELGNQTGTALGTGLQNSSPGAIRQVENAAAAIPAAVSNQLTQIPQIAQSALAPLPPTAQQIFLQLQPVVQGALAGLATTAQLGLASVAAALSAGGPTLIAAITTAFVGTDVAVTTAFTAMGAKATEGMTQLAADITAAFAQIITPAFAQGLTGSEQEISFSTQRMATAMTNGLVGVQAAAQAGLKALDDTFFFSTTTWGSNLITAMVEFSNTITTGLDAANANAITGLNAIQASFETWRTNIVTIATNAMNEFNSALTVGFANAQSVVDAAISTMVASLNAAVGSFRAAGENMGQALADGLRAKQAAVEAAAAALAAAAAAATRAAAGIHSPSKVFTFLGKMVGKGFILGIGLTLAETARVAEKLVAITSGALSQVTSTDWGTRIADSLSTISSHASMYATGASLNVDNDGLGSVGDRVADALSGWTVEIDQAGIAKLVNKQNLRNRRR